VWVCWELAQKFDLQRCGRQRVNFERICSEGEPNRTLAARSDGLHVGEREFLTYANYSFKRYDKVLERAMARGQSIYSAAYIMPYGGSLGHPQAATAGQAEQDQVKAAVPRALGLPLQVD